MGLGTVDVPHLKLCAMNLSMYACNLTGTFVLYVFWVWIFMLKYSLV